MEDSQNTDKKQVVLIEHVYSKAYTIKALLLEYISEKMAFETLYPERKLATRVRKNMDCE